MVLSGRTTDCISIEVEMYVRIASDAEICFILNAYTAMLFLNKM